MRDFNDCTWQEGTAAACSLLHRLAIAARLEKDGPLMLLHEFCCAVAAGSLPAAERLYHELTGELLAAPARRVSGDLFADYLLYILLERPHAFSRAAAAGRRDEHLWHAMKGDLLVLGRLFGLSGGCLRRMAQERQRELKLRPHQGRDDIAALSTAVWSGGQARLPRAGAAQPPAPAPLLSDMEWATWRYGEAGLVGSYVSDEALEEMYVRLMKAASWRSMQEDIWNFFAAYGCGAFLQSRLFALSGGELCPLPAAAAAPVTAVGLFEAQQARLMENAIRFMRGERAENVLITGGAGLGKTAQALAVAYELPELRLVLVPATEWGGLPGLMEQLRGQPLKFMVLLDDADLSSPALRSALACLCARNAQPQNVLLCATSRSMGGEGVFGERVALPQPDMRQFCELVLQLLELEGVHADPELVKNACVDYQVDERGSLSFAAAQRAAARYLGA